MIPLQNKKDENHCTKLKHVYPKIVMSKFASSSCCVSKHKQRYSVIQLSIKILAVITMAILAGRDVLALVRQYSRSTSVTNVNIRDDSESGFRLPNATVCVEFNPSREDVNITDFDYANFDSNQLREAVQFSKHVLTFADQESLRKNQTWLTIADQLSYYVNLSLIDNEKLSNFSRNLAFRLCRLMEVKVRSIVISENGRGSQLDVCNWARTGLLPFTANSDGLFCFRIPLDLMILSKGKLSGDETMGNMDDLGYKQQEIVLEFQPLKLRKTFRKDDGDDELMNTMIFLPEIPYSYSENVKRKLVDLPQTRFVHSLSFGKFYGLNYFRNTNVKVEFYVSAKYNRLSDKKDCLNVFNETTCYVECMERRFHGICKCNRYIFHHFLNDLHDDRSGLCTFKHYDACFDTYQSSLSIRDPERIRCMSECTKCAALNLQWQTKEQHRNWLRLQSRRNLKVLCELLNLFVNNSKQTYCLNFLDNVGDYVPAIFNDDNNVDVITGLGEAELSKKLFRSLIPTTALFGTVTYEFSMKSFKYPEYNETVSITKEGFLSQIGGILNLYLGISGLTCFMLIITGVRIVKKRHRKRQERIRMQTQSTLSMLHAWHVLSKEYLNNKMKTIKWMSSGAHNKNDKEVTIITIS